MKKLLSIFLAVITLAQVGVLSSCKDERKEEVSKKVIPIIQTEKEEDKYLTYNFKSDYKIVIPHESSDIVNTAAKEMQTFLYQSTNVELPIVDDGSFSYNESQKVISIGDTRILEGTQVTNTFGELGESGYKINTFGFQICISGATDTGTLYGCYGFLDYVIDFEAYSVDEVAFAKNTTTYVLDFSDYVHTPAIDVKLQGDNHTGSTELLLNNARMGLICGGNGAARTLETAYWGGGLNVHTTQIIVKPEEYQKEHPDWFWLDNGVAKQLCLSNEEMFPVFVENLKMFIETAPYSKFFNLGNMDNRQVCECEKCSEVLTQYGRATGASVIYARFLNKVSVEIDKWIEEEYPERVGKVFIGGLAYFAVESAPCYYDESTKTFTPVDDSVKLRDSVFMQYCTHDSCMAHALNDETCNHNDKFFRNFKGWATVSKHMKIYTYGSMFDELFMPFNDFGALQENMKLFSEYGVDYVYIEAAKNGNGPMNNLKQYLLSKLSDDPTLNHDQLVRDFMAHFYKEAGDIAYTYYRNLRDNYAIGALNNNTTICCGLYSYNPSLTVAKNDKSYWSKSFLDSSMELFEQGYQKIANSGRNESEKETLNFRLLNLELSVRYFLIKYYSAYYGQSELEEIKKEFLEDAARMEWIKNSIFTSEIQF